MTAFFQMIDSNEKHVDIRNQNIQFLIKHYKFDFSFENIIKIYCDFKFHKTTNMTKIQIAKIE